jgi:hypothetical protein
MSSEITALAEGKLYALSNSYELDGRVTTHPVDVRGYAPMQSYLLKEGDRSLIIGTGLSIHQQQVLDQLDSLVGSSQLSIMPLRFDFTGLCNARPIADRFDIEYVYQTPTRGDVPSEWLNIRPEFPADASDGLLGAANRVMHTGVPIPIDPAGVRNLDLVVPPLRLLPNNWVYDETTRTMFTLDTFTWIWRSHDDGPWVVTDQDEDPTTLETLKHYLFHNRYWWLPGASTSRIRRALAEFFERYDIENIAPDWGCALKGASVVSRHYQLLDDVLAAAEDETPLGVDVGKWTFAGAR